MKINYKSLLLGTLAFYLWQQSLNAQTPTSLESKDTRDSATTPGDYFHSFQFHFKRNGVMGLPASGKNYVSLLGLRAWGDNSGGKAHELAFTDDNQIYVRSGMSPSWESWRRLLMENSSGYVGIGTTAPQTLLHGVSGVADFRFSTGAAALTPTMSVINTNSGGKAAGLVAGTDGATFSFDQAGYFVIAAENKSAFINNAVGQGNYFFRINADGKVGVGTNYSPKQLLDIAGKFVVDGVSGNVGIGTTTPQAKLAVNGDIFSKKIKVTQSGWPDYVFESSYQLPSLQQIEHYVQLNKHLPDVPSASEIEAKGLDLGENQAVLLKKIEELTLYIIEQDKRQELTQQTISELSKQFEAQQKTIDQQATILKLQQQLLLTLTEQPKNRKLLQ